MVRGSHALRLSEFLVKGLLIKNSIYSRSERLNPFQFFISLKYSVIQYRPESDQYFTVVHALAQIIITPANRNADAREKGIQTLLVLIGIEGTNMDLRHISSQLLNEQQA